jgi:hypothetical protein
VPSETGSKREAQKKPLVLERLFLDLARVDLALLDLARIDLEVDVDLGTVVELAD